MPKTTQGSCRYCHSTFSKQTMKKHLDNCKARLEHMNPDKKNTAAEEQYLCIRVEGYEKPEYWMYLDVAAGTTMKRLDQFLRDMWLECCGHLSAFYIDGTCYTNSLEKDYDERSMSVKLSDILEIGMNFKHEYDFGSTTVLKFKVISERIGPKRREKIELMARNLAPEFKCAVCGAGADFICAECAWDGEEAAMLCEDCSHEHECGEEILLPVCNSPRMGVCGYMGGVYDEE